MKEYTKPENMETLKSREFSNQIHIALYGESIDEYKARLDKKTDEKIVLNNVVLIKKMLQLGKLSVSEIAEAFEVSEDFVLEVQSKI